MATYAFNFRQTSGGISPLTDGANTTYVLATDTSATTRNGITFQWDSGNPPDSRDRLTTGDARLAGINFRSNAGGEAFFKVTLPSTGDVTIRAAFGDGTGAQTQYVRFKEGTTTYATISAVASSSNEFVDASGVLRTTQATWISSNASISRTFTTTDFRVYVGDPASAGGNNTSIAHLFIDIAASSATYNKQRKQLLGVG